MPDPRQEHERASGWTALEALVQGRYGGDPQRALKALTQMADQEEWEDLLYACDDAAERLVRQITDWPGTAHGPVATLVQRYGDDLDVVQDRLKAVLAAELRLLEQGDHAAPASASPDADALAFNYAAPGPAAPTPAQDALDALWAWHQRKKEHIDLQSDRLARDPRENGDDLFFREQAFWRGQFYLLHELETRLREQAARRPLAPPTAPKPDPQAALLEDLHRWLESDFARLQHYHRENVNDAFTNGMLREVVRVLEAFNQLHKDLQDRLFRVPPQREADHGA